MGCAEFWCERRSRLRTGPIELVSGGHGGPSCALLKEAEFAAHLALHGGMGVAASDQDRGDQHGDAGRGDIGHRYVDPLPQLPGLEQATRLQAGHAHLTVIGPGTWRPHPQQQNHARHCREASGQTPADLL